MGPVIIKKLPWHFAKSLAEVDGQGKIREAAGGLPNWPQVLSAVYKAAVAVAAERCADAPPR